jgi:mono/diheme cytochrome c family protein
MKSILLFVFIFLPQVVLAGNDADQGEKLYKTYCSACHGATGGMDMSKRVAPPIIAVRMHYLGPYPDKAEFVAAVADWVEKQDASKTQMPGAIRRFNIMPPVSVAREDAEKIASYIYHGDIEKPAGFDRHFEEMHGKQRGNDGM